MYSLTFWGKDGQRTISSARLPGELGLSKNLLQCVINASTTFSEHRLVCLDGRDEMEVAGELEEADDVKPVDDNDDDDDEEEEEEERDFFENFATSCS